MKEHPIIFFSGEMVRAILEGRKTQTRRVIKEPVSIGHKINNGDIKSHEPMILHRGAWLKPLERSPYGKPGDRLWVRESFGEDIETGKIIYKADPNCGGDGMFTEKWKPSIHMPRWASRIMLEITNIRVERVEEITPKDIEAEGIDISIDGISTANHFRSDVITLFRKLWDSINFKRGFGWDTNPWIWVIEFLKVERR